MSSSFSALEAFLADISELTKSADNKTEPGNYDDGSAHPTAKIDSGTYESSEGERAREHDEDARKENQVADLPGVDTSPGPTLDEAATTVRTNPSFVGEDPSVEDNYDTKQEDPGTSHPAEFGSTTSEKVSSLADDELLEKMSELSNAILADIAMSAPRQSHSKSASRQEIAAAAAQAAAMANGQSSNQDEAQVKAALLAGYQAANQIIDLAEKQASEEKSGQLDEAQQLIYDALLEADEMAEKTAAALNTYFSELNKAAMHGEENEDEEGMASGTEHDEGAEGVASSPEEAANMVGEEMSLDDILDSAAASGDEPVDEEEALNELASAMMEMGVSPEELVAAAEEEGGEGKMASDKTRLKKLASAVTKYRRSGRFEFGPPKTKRAAKMRKELRKYVADVVGG